MTKVVRPGGEPRSADGTARVAGAQTVVYYFYTSSRCASCMRIEAWTKECLDQEFGSELRARRIAWKPVNLEDDGTMHFVEGFQVDGENGHRLHYRDGTPGRTRIWSTSGSCSTTRGVLPARTHEGQRVPPDLS